MVKLFFSLSGQMLKKFFGKQGLLKILFSYAVPGERIIFDFLLGYWEKLKIFILLNPAVVRNDFLELNKDITLAIANSYDNFLLNFICMEDRTSNNFYFSGRETKK